VIDLWPWVEGAMILVCAFFFACASWFCWCKIVQSGFSRKTFALHLIALLVSAAGVSIYFGGAFSLRAVFWVFGVYWVLTAVPGFTWRWSRERRRPVLNELIQAKLLLGLSVCSLGSQPDWMDAYLPAAGAMLLAANSIWPGKEKPAGPQVQPISSQG
jgi:apolipoprotein N-acyltransferase